MRSDASLFCSQDTYWPNRQTSESSKYPQILLQVQFNIIPSSAFEFSKWSSGLPSKHCMLFYSSTYKPHAPSPAIHHQVDGINDPFKMGFEAVTSRLR